MTLGRPTKYKPEYCDRLIDFFDVEPMTLKDDKWIAARFPTFARFACTIDVCMDTLQEWAYGKDKEGNLKHPDFSLAYKKAKQYQESYLYECGMTGAIDKTFGIWATKTLLGHSEQQKIEHTITKSVTDEWDDV